MRPDSMFYDEDLNDEEIAILLRDGMGAVIKHQKREERRAKEKEEERKTCSETFMSTDERVEHAFDDVIAGLESFGASIADTKRAFVGLLESLAPLLNRIEEEEQKAKENAEECAKMAQVLRKADTPDKDEVSNSASKEETAEGEKPAWLKAKMIADDLIAAHDERIKKKKEAEEARRLMIQQGMKIPEGQTAIGDEIAREAVTRALKLFDALQPSRTREVQAHETKNEEVFAILVLLPSEYDALRRGEIADEIIERLAGSLFHAFAVKGALHASCPPSTDTFIRLRPNAMPSRKGAVFGWNVRVQIAVDAPTYNPFGVL